MIEIFFVGLVLAISPGPDFFLLTSNTLSHGKKIGFLTLLGNRVSFTMHLTFALLGLSIILQQSVILFTIIKTLGALYLIYIGITKLKSSYSSFKNKKGILKPKSYKIGNLHACRMGFLSNFLNPKVSIFFLSVFPQFVSPEQIASQPFFIAAVILIANSSWYVFAICVVGLSFIKRLFLKFQLYLDLLFGLVFVIYGVRLISEEIHHVLTQLSHFRFGRTA
ncbi:LysE family translocator [Aureibacillus halotolerans]|uniref:Threonine/homoserine/homoserine lactone efflux protein n=1 Tax=Aureibacillus halotolerans TaxID=1508390 RepID=A0A4R6U6F9_9BACI|nr:LysE family translocator [Aureibacillus halotolerans]TDQ40453.1 threonine/homoserine/homoserine lactone efflux protein [Aureibacillus halotolerans]